MNRVVLLAVFCVLFSALPAFAADVETITGFDIPGGVVCSNGKDAIYLHFKTMQRTNLTANLEGAVIDGPYAGSESGNTLIWVQDEKLMKSVSPFNKMEFVKERKLTGERKGQYLLGKTEDCQDPRWEMVKNLSLSPCGEKLAFELKRQGQSLVMAPPSPELNMRWISASALRPVGPGLSQGTAPEDQAKYINLPLYLSMPDVGNQISVANLEYKAYAGEQRLCFIHYRLKLGNFATRAGVYPHRRMPPEIGAVQYKMLTSEDYGPLIQLTQEETIRKFSIRRDAHFFCWHKNPEKTVHQMMAVIFLTPYGWGPIEIRDSRERGLGDKQLNVPTSFYEIPYPAKGCSGLAWKPDGSLTYLCGEKLFKLDGEKIREGIKRSCLVKNPNPDPGTVLERPIPAKNVFNIKETLEADGIFGSKICWVSDDAFIFLGIAGQNDGLYLWKKGNITKLLYTVPTDYFYCQRNPLADEVKEAAVNVVSNTDGVSSGTATAPDCSGSVDKTLQVQKPSSFRVGNLELKCHAFKRPWDKSVNTVAVAVKIEEQETLCALVDDGLDSIKSPEAYEYKRIEEFDAYKHSDKPKTHVTVLVGLGQTLMIRRGNSYTAINPLSLERKYNSLMEVPPKERERFKHEWEKTRRVDVFKSMTYEWKYWPTASATRVAASK